ncbi:hypothetical protein HDU67_002569, partial [Dinochytrium kinnereticum]
KLDSASGKLERQEIHTFRSNLLWQYMRDHNVPPSVQKMVIEHRIAQWRSKKELDENHIFEDLPKDLLQQTKNHLYLDLVKTVPFFAGLDDSFFNFVTLKIQPMSFVNHCFIFRMGDSGNMMFIIKRGAVEIIDRSGNVLVVLKEGACFGEVALYKDCTRTASARAIGNVELCGLSKEAFRGILRSHTEFDERVREKINAMSTQHAAAAPPPPAATVKSTPSSNTGVSISTHSVVNQALRPGNETPSLLSSGTL